MSKKSIKYVLIAGCGRLGAGLASFLSEKGLDVIIIDSDRGSFRKLSDDYSGFSMEADATDIDVLKSANIEKADVVVAATNDDNTNIMIGQIAKELFHVDKVIARIYDPSREGVYQDFRIETICPSQLSMLEFEKLLTTYEEGRQS